MYWEKSEKGFFALFFGFARYVRYAERWLL